ncbi:MAG: cysteine--tRNA ligase [Candidatus Omnitrophica bacterium]|nr:cysteine--tRNA ligase [Candidatus Omnitrophota bacterium]
MSFRIQNTLTGAKEEFRPLDDSRVGMYVCGPTVYDDPHVGHVRSAFVFDVIRRILSTRYNVTLVRNVTDVDDKIIERARTEGVDINTISERYLKSYHEALSLFDITPPDHEPRATADGTIRGMIEMCRKLVDAGIAYESSGSVYFSVRKFPSYGRLSGQDIDRMCDHWRGEPGEGKRDPLDFALWKRSRENEPRWDSPWGPGRPGWHIECSVMSSELLGEEFDIHGGGRDLVFPHHENELAQSAAATGKGFARVWIHHGLVTTEGQKMSKSLGNFITLPRILERFPSDVLRMFFLGSHYSHDVDFTWDKMHSVAEALRSFAVFFEKSGVAVSPSPDSGGDKTIGEYQRQFDEAIRDDFGTPQAMAALFEALREANRRWDRGDKAAARSAGGWILERGRLLGLFGEIGKSGENTSAAATLGELVELREACRQQRRYEVSDFIRAELTGLGFHVEDGRSASQIMELGVRMNERI